MRDFKRRSAVGLVAALAAIVLSPVQPAAAADDGPWWSGGFLQPANSGLCVVSDVDAIDTIPPTPTGQVIQATCRALRSTAWKAVPVGDGTYNVVSRRTGECMAVQSASTADSANVVMAACTPTVKNDQFRLRPVPGKPTLQIIAEHSGKCLNVQGGGSTNRTPIIQSPCATATGLNAQFAASPSPLTAVRQPVTSNSPVVFTQGAPQEGAALGSLIYAYVNNLGSLRVGYQQNPDLFSSVQWSTPAGLEGFTGRVQVGAQADGRVQVAARNVADGDNWTLSQSTKGLAPFDPAQDVGGASVQYSTLGRAPDGTLILFGVAGGLLWQLPQDGVNTPYLGWHGGSFIGGPGNIAAAPAVVTLRDTMRVFAITTGGTMWTGIYQGGVYPAATAVSLGGSELVGTPAAVVYPGFRTRVFARTRAGAIVTKLENVDGTFPAAWSQIGGFVTTGSPAAVLDPNDGRINVVARGADDRVYFVSETGVGTSEWGDWIQAGPTVVATDPTATLFNQSGAQTWGYVVRDQNDRVLLNTKNDVGSQSLRAAGAPAFTTHRLPLPPR